VSDTERCPCRGSALLVVPGEVALSYDGRRWRLLPAPPDWWVQERDAGHVPDAVSGPAARS
jgi:hypothetical protein